MSEYDRRQYRLILDRLGAFAHGRITLRMLIDDLRSLAEALEYPSKSWKEDFMSEWWTLEQVYAVGIDRGDLAGAQAKNQELVGQTVKTLTQLATRALESEDQE